MNKFTIGMFELNQVRKSDFEEFISIVKGRSIVSGASWGEERLELGLSGNVMVRFFKTPDETVINLIDTTNKDDLPCMVVDMGDMERRVPISIIEKKLNGLRTLYAIYYLVYDGRANELQSYLIKHPHGDIEAALLKEDEQLYIESISYGSWVLTLWAKSEKAIKAVSSVAGLVYQRGREAFLAKREAEVKLLNAQVKSAEIKAANEEFKLQKSQLDYLLAISDKMDIPEVKEHVKNRIIHSAKDLTLGDRTESNSYLSLK